MKQNNQTTPNSPSPDKLETVPANIILFPGQPCRKVAVVRKSGTRGSEPAALNILQLPQGRTRSKDDVRQLFADTGEILRRVAPRW